MTAVYLDDFVRLAANGGDQADWLQGLRQAARSRFDSVGLPTNREEDWRFNNLRPIIEGDFRLATPHGAGVEV